MGVFLLKPQCELQYIKSQENTADFRLLMPVEKATTMAEVELH